MKKPQLFFLHFAGGNCYSFNFLAPLLKEFELVPLELPGRGKRMSEPLLKDFELAARDIFDQINKRRHSSDYLIFGHSMGAYLALRVANLLKIAAPLPLCVIVSGNAGPGVHDKTKRHLLGKEEFTDMLRTLGGVSEEVLANKELLEFFDPILRADFEIAEENEIEKEPPLSIPLCAIMGTEEEKVGQITNWNRYTLSHFTCEVLEGGHFFIHKHPQRIAGIIKECYDNALLLQHK